MWSSIDSNEVPNSGSVRVPNSQNFVAHGIESVCLPIEAGNAYRVAASALWIDAESSMTGAVQLRVEFYQNGSCQPGGSRFADSTGLVSIASDAWRHVEVVLTAPAGSSSATVNLWNWKDTGAGTFVAYFDDAELVSLPEPNESLLGIEAVASLSGLRSRRRSANRPR